MLTSQDKTPWGLLFILFGAGVLSACQVGKAPPVLSDIRSDFGISLSYAGWILSIFSFTGLLLGTCTGVIADTIGHRRLMLTGFVLQIAGCILGSISQSFYGLLFARFLEGTGFLSVGISIPSLIFQVVRSKDIKIALAVWSCYMPVGIALMMVIVPMVMICSTWRGLWQLNAVILAVYALILLKMIRPVKFMNIPSQKIKPGKMLRDIYLTTASLGPLLIASVFAVYTLQWITVMGFLPTLMIEKFQFSKSCASMLTALMVAVNIFGNLAAGKLLNRGIRRWKLILFASFVMGSCAIVIYSDTLSFAINYSGCLAFSIFGGLIPASLFSGVPLYSPSSKLIGTTNGLIMQGGQSGQVVGPPILGFLVSKIGSWSCGAWFIGSFAILGIILSLVLSQIRPSKLH